MRPLLGSMSRFTIFKVVVFPQPDGPTRTEISPSGTSRVRSLTAMVPSGKRLETESRRIIGPDPRSVVEGYPGVSGAGDHLPRPRGRSPRPGRCQPGAAMPGALAEWGRLS